MKDREQGEFYVEQPVCPTCGGWLDVCEHSCDNMVGGHVVDKATFGHKHNKTTTSRFKDGELVIGEVSGQLKITKEDSFVSVITGNVCAYAPDMYKPLTIGVSFTTVCNKSIFASGQGEFVVVDRKQDTDADDMIVNLNGKIVCLNDASMSDIDWFIVLPTIASGYWDREIGDTGVWVRRYETEKGCDYDYMFASGASLHRHYPINIKRDVQDYSADIIMNAFDAPVIPYSLSNGEFTAPKGRTK